MPIDLPSPANQKRLLKMDFLLRKGYPGHTREEIVRHLRIHCHQSISLSTFNRDISRLRALGAPIDHQYREDGNGKSVGWYYTDTAWTLSTTLASKDILRAFLVAQNTMRQYVGLPAIANALHQAIGKIFPEFTREVTVHPEKLMPVSFSAENQIQVDPDHWSLIVEATQKHRYLRITYKKGWGAGSGKTTTRDIAPYHIVNLQGVWYLLGSASHADPALRQYAFTRIQKVEMLDGAAIIPENLDVAKMLEVTFGQFIGDPDNLEEIHIRFDRSIAHLVTLRQFSARETKTELPNGDIDLRFPASPSGPLPHYHIKSWVLSWGANATVIAPESLKNDVRQEIARMAERAHS